MHLICISLLRYTLMTQIYTHNIGEYNHKFILLKNKTTLSKELHDTAKNLWLADPAESSGSGSGLTLKNIINVERPFNTHTGEKAVLDTHRTVLFLSSKTQTENY